MANVIWSMKARIRKMVDGNWIGIAADEELYSLESNHSVMIGQRVLSHPALFWVRDPRAPGGFRRPRSIRVVATHDDPYETGGVYWARTRFSVVVR